jgi:hypothetical protein
VQHHGETKLLKQQMMAEQVETGADGVQNGS